MGLLSLASEAINLGGESELVKGMHCVMKLRHQQ